ncbi:MAG: CDP-glycerol:poly(glycerophosphate) glycerophosphotransferase [Sporomusa sp.]|nr:CDP-glycerol:poly(glycerophosphate) glycerophosphotransferase [Sporomusa sp.]
MFRSLRKLFSKALRSGITMLLYYLIIFPSQCCMPIKKKSIVLIGKYGSFSDNVKYLFLYIHNQGKKDISVAYIVKDRSLYDTLRAEGLPVLLHPSPRSVLAMIRSAIVIVAGNISNFDSLCSSRAYKVQLWHGATMKKTGSLKKKQYGDYAWIYKASKAIGFSKQWGLATSPSQFYSKNVFAERFKPIDIIESGFPRNDCLFREISPQELIGSDIELIQRIQSYKEQGYRIVLYAPTFRDTGGDAMADGILNLKDLSNFGQKNNIIFIFKMHYKAKTTKNISYLSHVWEYDRQCDTYPMMSLADLLITDYSSIYMDYVLLDRPIVFFPYDYEKYIKKDREITFDYDWITPGPKCRNQSDLFHAIQECLIDGKDSFKSNRQEIADLGFTYKDGLASQRIFEFLQAKM